MCSWLIYSFFLACKLWLSVHEMIIYRMRNVCSWYKIFQIERKRTKKKLFCAMTSIAGFGFFLKNFFHWYCLLFYPMNRVTTSLSKTVKILKTYLIHSFIDWPSNFPFIANFFYFYSFHLASLAIGMIECMYNAKHNYE